MLFYSREHVRRSTDTSVGMYRRSMQARHNVKCMYYGKRDAHVLPDNALICRSFAIHALTLARARARHTYTRSFPLESEHKRVRKRTFGTSAKQHFHSDIEAYDLFSRHN